MLRCCNKSIWVDMKTMIAIDILLSTWIQTLIKTLILSCEVLGLKKCHFAFIVAITDMNGHFFKRSCSVIFLCQKMHFYIFSCKSSAHELFGWCHWCVMFARSLINEIEKRLGDQHFSTITTISISISIITTVFVWLYDRSP